MSAPALAVLRHVLVEGRFLGEFGSAAAVLAAVRVRCIGFAGTTLVCALLFALFAALLSLHGRHLAVTAVNDDGTPHAMKWP